MKTQLQLLIIFLLFAVYGANGQCPSGSIVFNNQTDIDNFIINYPNCEQIDGNVEIMFGNITNLNGLSNITSVNGSLYIQFNDFLTDISGLSSLENISGDFLFMANPDVLNLDALNSLTNVNGYVQIMGNNNLNDITGLINLDSSTITELKITENPPLQICNLPNFCSYLSNPVATHPREIWGNSGNCINLTTLTDTCSLPCPTGDWTFGSQTDLDNFKLNYSFCENIVLNDVTIEWPSVANLPFISNLSALENVINITGNLSIASHQPLNDLSGLNSLTNVSGFLRITFTGDHLESLTGLESLITIGGDFIIEGPMSNTNYLQDFQGLNSLTSIGGRFSCVLIGMTLSSFNGLDSLTSVGELFINLSYSLTSLDGLNLINITEGKITITYNSALTDISALQNVSSDLTHLSIYYNPQLSFCHLPVFCEYLSNPAETHPRYINGNALGCESETEILAECALSTDDFLLENNWLVYKQDNQFEIQTTGFELKEVAVYDMLGRKVYQNKANATSHTISDIASNGLLIIKIITSENKILTKKVIN